MLVKSKLNNPFYAYLLMLVLGILSGISDISYLHSFAQIIADIFIKIFKCISPPIICLSILVTLASFSEDGTMSRVWRKTIFYTISTTILAATISCMLYILLQPSNINVLLNNEPVTTNTVTYFQHLSALIPGNLLVPFLENQVLSILLIGITIGIAIRFIPEKETRIVVTHFFKGLYSIFLVITKWIVKILPLGLYGFITTTIVSLDKNVDLNGIGTYLIIIVLANLVQGFIVLPIWLALNDINPIKSLQKMLPALSVAFFSKSSTGTLPITMEVAEKRLNINPKISRLILPLCTSINMNGCAAFIFTTVIYLMQNNGLEISYITMACWIIIATVAAIGNAGIPMGCFFLSANLLSSMGVPITLLGLILPFYSFIDMIETSLNVWSDSCVATVINKDYENNQKEKVTDIGLGLET